MKPTILIVEDDPRNLKLLSDLLTLKGYAVLVALDGVAGLAMARGQRPGLILTDILMPHMDGLEMTRLLKGDPQTRALAVWALTSFAMPGDEARVRAKGCDNYFTKPINLCDLLTRIARHFDNGAQPPVTCTPALTEGDARL